MSHIIELVPEDTAYPELVRTAVGHPERLYCLGSTEPLARPAVSIIGSRKMTCYGERVVRMLVPELVAAGLAIVSGLAYGVDAFAHTIALESGGTCIAVLGSGLDRIYPASHYALSRKIIQQGGCLLSEYPLGMPPLKYHFPARNRIVASLSRMTVIIEAGEKSGTLITARHALDAGRDVGVVPADITRDESRGAFSLLKQGARPVVTAEDILASYNVAYERTFPTVLRPALTGSMATLYDLISQGVGRSDDLLAASGLRIDELQSVLSVLELDGYIYYRDAVWQRI